MSTFFLHRLDETGVVVRSEMFTAASLDAARDFAKARLPGYAEVQIWDYAGPVAAIFSNPMTPPQSRHTGS
jgi:hypothetical protein